MKRIQVLGGLAVLAVGVGVALAQAPANMGFFVAARSRQGRRPEQLGRAPTHCQSLPRPRSAQAAAWHAYLSTNTVNAEDRIGDGPWYNAKGPLIAQSVADLHQRDKQISATRRWLEQEGVARTIVRRTPPAPLARHYQHSILTGADETARLTQPRATTRTDGADTAIGDPDHIATMQRRFMEAHPSVEAARWRRLAPTSRRNVLLLCDELIS